MVWFFSLRLKCHKFCRRSKTQVFFTILVTLAAPHLKFSTCFSPLIFFNPAIILIKKKMRFGRFKVWFGTKAANIGDFGHFNFTFGHYYLSKWAHISRTYRKKCTRTFCWRKKSILSNKIGENQELEFLLLKLSSVQGQQS